MSSLPRAVSCLLALVVAATTLADPAEVSAGKRTSDRQSRAGMIEDPQTVGCSRDATRTQAVLRRLGSQKRGSDLLTALGRPLVVCYGDVAEGMLQTDGVVVLQKDRPVTANAARLGHLVQHLVHGLPFDEKVVRADTVACDELVKKAMLAERLAHDIENHLRRAFRLPPLAFEDLSGRYLQRCEALRKDPTNPAAM